MPESERFFNPQERKEDGKHIEVETFLVEPITDYSDLIRENRARSTYGIDLSKDENREAYFSSYSKHLIENYSRYESLSGKPEETLDDYDKETMLYWETLKSKIAGKILIDLGAGEVKNDLRNLAHELGATTYIRVDALNPWEGEASQYGSDAKTDLSKGEMLGDTQIITIKDDMLDFLSRLPEDQRICFVINGINSSLITNQDYHNNLFNEIEGKLSPGNIMFGSGSDVLKMGEGRPNIKNLVPSFYMRWKILEKTEK